MQDIENNYGQQTAPVSPSSTKLTLFDSFTCPVMQSLFRQSIKTRFEKLAFDAKEPHDLCYEHSTALETSDTLQRIKAWLQLVNEETCFLYNEVRLLESMQKV